jgi:hypothetical protein
MKLIYTIILFALMPSIVMLTGCASKEIQGADISTRLDDSSYEKLLDKHTRHDVQYDGVYNKFELYATFINSDVQSAILQKKSDIYQWDTRQAQSEREKMFQENSTQTKFALSFFTPTPRLNDLHKGATIWKIYLDVNGQRYVGKATKRNGKLEDLSAIFPKHNRWSVPYDIVFNVPLSGAEQGQATFIITGSQGTSTLKF